MGMNCDDICDPGRDTELDDRLERGLWSDACSGIQAGISSVRSTGLAGYIGLKYQRSLVEHWLAGQSIAENWRMSTHRLLEQLDHSGEASTGETPAGQNAHRHS